MWSKFLITFVCLLPNQRKSCPVLPVRCTLEADDIGSEIFSQSDGALSSVMCFQRFNKHTFLLLEITFVYFFCVLFVSEKGVLCAIALELRLEGGSEHQLFHSWTSVSSPYRIFQRDNLNKTKKQKSTNNHEKISTPTNSLARVYKQNLL